MMGRWRLLLIGAGAYALALIATAPSTLLDAALKDASGGRVRLAEAQGTLWSGSAHVEVRDPAQRAAFAKRIAWRLKPTSIFRAKLVFDVGMQETAKHFPLTLSPSRIAVETVDLSVPATALAIVVPKLAPLALTGEIFLYVEHLTFDRAHLVGNATARWPAAGSALTRISPLGGYELRMDAASTAVRASLRTLQGPLELHGEGSWLSGAKPALQVRAQVPPQHERELAPLLRLVAVERGPGRFELELR